MREEVHALKKGLVGHIRLAAVPSALPFVQEVVTPIATRYDASGSPCCR
ncbi:hypothetical protein A6302_01142 [Methylobrevis pamukkalensis]|uniref:Uncharacterized protein n=1 Tax=Methylobrevis pamukkalensis TaxID=1439726 RepID=A0A1E3H5C3_9HYPH|nr:hypothetical protein A6302_01142 [Methylobrevis pamukkalensis]